ncbi:MAG: phytanoyl-CoA dioxygenase family protein [Planctomycetota bacterium]|nr:phytanoyl-CoA dioxygenase family protein [Planctomycetota bacterium]MDA1212038.1 phytanoyl-CoA dioxygenase family protein [Planctomycetota bacterium]
MTKSPPIDDRNWSALTLGERIRQLEVEGYLVLPDLLNADEVHRLKECTARFQTKAVDYSVHQQYVPDVQFFGGAITELIAHPPTIRFLKELFGEPVVMMSYHYARSEPGHPGISLHADGQPYGSEIFGYEGSCPWLVRVLYYLDDLTADVSPFRVVPRSQLSMHPDGNPYLRYHSHPEEVMVTCRAGSAVLINHRVFHGNYPNTGTRSRELLALGYRPGWAGPIQEVENWDAAEVAKLSPEIQAVMGNRNQRVWDFQGTNKPANMKSEAPGMNPSRWERI